MNEKDILYYEALMELAEALGHTNANPLSLSLLCLGHGINFEDKCKICVEFNEILREYSFDELTVDLFKEAIMKVNRTAEDFSDIVVVGFIKAFAKNLIPELYPFSMTLD